MRRLLQVSPFHPGDLEMGGPVQLVRQIAMPGAMRVFETVGVVCPEMGSGGEGEHWNTIECSTVLRYRTVRVTELKPMRKAIAECDAVLIHGYRHWLSFWAARECQRTGKPYVMHLHGMANLRFRSYGKKWLFDRLGGAGMVANARGVIFSSRREAEEAGGCLGRIRRSAIVPNAIEKSPVFDHDEARAKWTERLGLDRSRPFLLTLGRLSPTKNYEALIRMLSIEWPVSLVIAGPGEDSAYCRSLRALADQVSGSAVVFHAGVYGPEKQSLLAAADVFLTASVLDSFNLTVAEALYQGTPVVLPRWLGIAEHLDAVPCHLVDSLKAEELRHQARLALGGQRPAPGFKLFHVEQVLTQLESALADFFSPPIVRAPERKGACSGKSI